MKIFGYCCRWWVVSNPRPRDFECNALTTALARRDPYHVIGIFATYIEKVMHRARAARPRGFDSLPSLDPDIYIYAYECCARTLQLTFEKFLHKILGRSTKFSIHTTRVECTLNLVYVLHKFSRSLY